MTSVAESILSLTDIHAGYDSTPVLRDVSLTVRPSQVVALLGPNGAGKTTVLRTATGTIRPNSGRVVLDGEEVTTAAPHKRAAAGLCLIPEGRGVFRSLTVRENLHMQVRKSEVNPAEAIERAMDVFPALSGRMKELAGRLSGGQQQMLALARAYVTRPRVILLDEVSMGLAPKVVDELFGALRDLAKQGTAMLLVEQYVSRALEMADHVVLMAKGRVAYNGHPAELNDEDVLQGYLGIDS